MTQLAWYNASLCKLIKFNPI